MPSTTPANRREKSPAKGTQQDSGEFVQCTTFSQPPPRKVVHKNEKMYDSAKLIRKTERKYDNDVSGWMTVYTFQPKVAQQTSPKASDLARIQATKQKQRLEALKKACIRISIKNLCN